MFSYPSLAIEMKRTKTKGVTADRGSIGEISSINEMMADIKKYTLA